MLSAIDSRAQPDADVCLSDALTRRSWVFELGLERVMPLTKGEAISNDETKENDGDLCNTPTRAPPREQWRAAPELDELKEVIGTRAQVLAAIKLQARRHAPRGTQPCVAAR